MNYRKKATYLFILLALTLVVSFQVSAAEYNRQPDFNLYGSFGDQFTGQASLLYPFNNKEDSLFYTDLRGMIGSNDISEWNLGFGYRKKIQDRDFILGTYLFKDNRKEFNRDWNQWTIGGELLTKNMDFRFNYYLPEKDRVLASSLPNDSVKVVGNSLVYEKAQLNTYYEVMGGYDLEFGKRFTETEGFLKNFGTFFRVYNFAGDDTITMSGIGVKIDKTFGNPNDINYKLGVDWQNDNIRGSSTEATFEISIPLGKSSKSSLDKPNDELENRMTEKARRDIDVIIGETKPERVLEAKEVAQDTDGDNTFIPAGKVWYVSANGDGNGSKDDPINLKDLFAPVNAESIELNRAGNNTNIAEEGDIIILLGNEGDFLLTPEELNSLRLEPRQKLISPGGYLKIYSESDQTRYQYFKPEGKTATIKSDNSIEQFNTQLRIGIADMVQLTNNNTVSGINFVGASDEALFGNGEAVVGDNVTGKINITNNTFSNLETAINIKGFKGESKINIKNNRLDNVAFGISVGNEDIFRGGPIMPANTNQSVEFTSPLIHMQSEIGDIKVTISENIINDSLFYGILTNLDRSTNHSITIDNNEIDLRDLNEVMIEEDGFISPMPPFMMGNGIFVNTDNAINAEVKIYKNKIKYAYQDGILVTSWNPGETNDIQIYKNQIGKVGSPYIDYYDYEANLTDFSSPSEYDLVNNGITVAVLNDLKLVNLEKEVSDKTNILIENNSIAQTYNDGISVLNMGGLINTTIKGNDIGLTRNNGISYYNLNNYMRESTVLNQQVTPYYNNIEITNNNIKDALQYGIASYNSYDAKILFEDNNIEKAAQGGILYFSHPENEMITLQNNSFGENVKPKILPYILDHIIR